MGSLQNCFAGWESNCRKFYAIKPKEQKKKKTQLHYDQSIRL